MKLFLLLVTFVCQIIVAFSAKAYHVKIHQDHDTFGDGICTILSDFDPVNYRGLTDENELRINSRPAVQAPADAKLVDVKDDSSIIEIFGLDRNIIQGHIDTICKRTEKVQPLEKESDKWKSDQKRIEVIKIVDGGPNENRIDVVFMGDGFNGSQQQQFIDDITRLTTEMFEGETFRSWLPLFNIWAIYVESVDSGIGYDGPINTPFQLYRRSGELRVIYPGNSQYARQVCTLTGVSGCDYPSLIGNDDFYGGLGGEFVISTKSNRTGSMVLRHEMGHNFADVGDEYDNSPTYFGVNSANTVASLGWTSWLTGVQREERAMYRLLAYPWADLANGPQSFNFTSDGTYSRWYCLVSVSAAGEADSLEFTLDGQILPWTTTGFDDREFYSWSSNQGFSSGTHTFSVRSKTPSTHPAIPRMIGSINIHEYGSESEFEADNNHISAYPTWGENGQKTFRPTNVGCLMRDVTNGRFCHVCKEGMWYQFLARVSLIDSIDISEPGPGGNRNATVHTLKLGQWRPIGNEIEGERLEIRWYLNSIDQSQYNDQLTIENIPAGNWRVTATLFTLEVRSDPDGLLSDSQTFTINSV